MVSVYALAEDDSNRPSYSNPQTLSCIVDEIRAILYTYSPDSFALLEDLITTERINEPIKESVRSAAELNIARAMPFDMNRRHELTVNEFIAHYGRSNRLFFSLRSVSHYLKHHFQFSGRNQTGRANAQNDLCYLFLVDGEVVRLQIQNSALPLVHTSVSTRNLPEELQSANWNTYVAADVFAISNNMSVFGLLVEYAAFLFEYQVLNDMTDYVLQHLDVHKFNTRLVQNFLTSLSRQPFFYEFTFWILHHLIFLQENHPRQFRTIMDNKEFLQVFAYVYQSFSQLVYEEAPENFASVLERIAELGGSYQIENDTITINCRHYRTTMFWIVSQHSRTNGNGVARIMQELETPPYVQMLETLLARADANK
jgi:hypothetical protein